VKSELILGNERLMKQRVEQRSAFALGPQATTNAA
jgi:hypothetical protein